MKRNIWSLYYLFLAISLISLLGLVLATYQVKKQTLIQEQQSQLQLMKSNFYAALAESELLLNIVGECLHDGMSCSEPHESEDILDKVLASRKNLAGFSFTNLRGEVTASSGFLGAETSHTAKYGLLSTAEFIAQLDSYHMLIGKTRLLPELGSWVIPLHKTIRDEYGEVLGVMSTAMRLDKSNSLESFKAAPHSVVIYNPANNHYSYINQIVNNIHHLVYDEPVNQSLFNYVSQQFTEQFQIDFLNPVGVSHEQSFHLEVEGDRAGKRSFSEFVFCPTYKLWFIYAKPVNEFYWDLLPRLLLYMLLFMAVQAIVWWLVNNISVSESNARKKLKFKAEHDTLTKIHNRRFLSSHFADYKTQSESAMSLLFLDLDNFKHVNDTFGHSVGDKLLQQVAIRLLEFSVQANCVIRFGGDEFVILLTDNSQQDQQVAKQINQRLSETYAIDELKLNIACSIGITRSENAEADLETMLRQADLAMYAAKKYKNAVTVFCKEMEHQTLHQATIEHHLRKALENNEISLHYQPQMDRNQKLYGVECLVRWHSESLGFVPPDQFINLAENIGIMPDVGHHIAATAVKQMAELQQQLKMGFQVSVNVSVTQFHDEKFFDQIMVLLEDSGFKAENLTLEVTESLFIEDLDRILEMLGKFRAEGISVSMDDFGTGYSSLSLLRKLPIDELKIDKSFIDDLLTDDRDAALIRNILGIARDLGMKTVAEGVEEGLQVATMLDYGCDYYQGYHFSKPLSLEMLQNFIENQA